MIGIIVFWIGIALLILLTFGDWGDGNELL